MQRVQCEPVLANITESEQLNAKGQINQTLDKPGNLLVQAVNEEVKNHDIQSAARSATRVSSVLTWMMMTAGV